MSETLTNPRSTAHVPATSALAPVERSAPARAIIDTWVITLRDLTHWRNNPGPVIVNWLFPVLMMVMFIGLFGGAIGASNGTSYIDFVMPGVFAMAMFFGLESTMTAVSQDASRGVTDRFRSLPMSSLAVVAGRCSADLLNSAIGLAVVVIAGLAFGWRPTTTPSEVIAAFALLLLLRLAMLWIGIFLGLKIKNQASITSIQVAVWPLLFFSSVFIDTSTMPRWLGYIAELNPLSATATAARELLGNPGFPPQSWPAENAVALALVVPIALIVVFLPLSVRAYRGLSR